jgi:hypothetical protein
MSADADESTTGWDEQSSRTFIDYGRYFVPERELQIETICDLIPPRDGPLRILELCCGPGLLAQALLSRLPNSRVHGLDGSPEMLRTAQSELAQYGERFTSSIWPTTTGAPSSRACTRSSRRWRSTISTTGRNRRCLRMCTTCWIVRACS